MSHDITLLGLGPGRPEPTPSRAPLGISSLRSNRMGSQICGLTVPQLQIPCDLSWFFFPASHGRNTHKQGQGKWSQWSDLSPLEPQSEESPGASQELSPRQPRCRSACWGSDVVLDVHRHYILGSTKQRILRESK